MPFLKSDRFWQCKYLHLVYELLELNQGLESLLLSKEVIITEFFHHNIEVRQFYNLFSLSFLLHQLHLLTVFLIPHLLHLVNGLGILICCLE